MKKIFVSDLKIGDQIFGEVFAVKSFIKKASRQNKPYFDVELSDATGLIKAKVWSDDFSNVENVAEGDVAEVSGTVEDFKGPQLKITNLKKTQNYEIKDLQQISKFDIEDMWQEVEAELKTIKNPHLKRLAEKIFDKNMTEKFKTAPAALRVHHAYSGGLLEHTWEMLKMASGIKKHFPKINMDLVKIGILLHDIGKTEELNIGTVIEQTDKGKLLGHIYIGAELVKKAGDDIPEELLSEIIHIVLSHHGEREYGSPVLPMTTEAIAVNSLDIASSKINMAYGHIHEGLGTEKYTPFISQLGTELYRSPYSEELINEDIPF